MTNIEITLLGLVVIILLQTSYQTYKTSKTTARISNSDTLVDTSVLMDGRILGVAETGFLPGRMVVPRSVIGELQLLADAGDSDKRERARQGLDVVKALQTLDNVDLTILQDGSVAREGVDERLLAHAKKYGASICTIDYNLNKVAQVENIAVLNINELAKQLRMTHLPGERLSLALTTKGSDGHQAVGHLDDGTMVVVEHAKQYIGKTIDVEIIRSLQTSAGKMMFAKLVETSKPSSSKEASQKPKQSQKKSNNQSAGGRKSRNSTSKSSPRNNRKKSNNEDRLIALVNQAED